MVATARESFGTVFKMGPQSGSLVAYVVTGITPPNMTRDAVDVTTHSSAGGAMESIGDGVYDPGELSVSMNYVGGDAKDDAFIAALTDGDTRSFSITVNAGTTTETMTFDGIVTSYGPGELGVKGKQSATATVKITGAITQAATV